MELEAVLKKILDRFNDDYQESSRIRALEKIISEGADQYKYAEEMAREVGKILNGALRMYLPEALTNGMLYRKAAEVVLKQPMLKAVKPVSEAASSVQKNINAQAGIGIKPIIPEVNEDQVNGIITGICNAESYESGKETLFDQVENFLEGHVDDSVHDNAGFQYEAGLDPTVTRSAAAKCCKWCDQLAGTYDYEKVRNKGNDVWKRHKNCHCIIEYDPGEKTIIRRNTDARRWTFQGDEVRARGMVYGEPEEFRRDHNKVIVAKSIPRYRKNKLFIEDGVDLSKAEINEINSQITKAKKAHRISGSCDATFVIVNDEEKLASYLARTNVVFISSRMSDSKNIIALQKDYACSYDKRSTLIHELFHWKDADEYRKNFGTITSTTRTSEYTMYQIDRGERELIKAGYISADSDSVMKLREISKYALEKCIDNDYEEAYTELRTKMLIESGGKR